MREPSSISIEGRDDFAGYSFNQSTCTHKQWKVDCAATERLNQRRPPYVRFDLAETIEGLPSMIKHFNLEHSCMHEPPRVSLKDRWHTTRERDLCLDWRSVRRDHDPQVAQTRFTQHRNTMTHRDPPSPKHAIRVH